MFAIGDTIGTKKFHIDKFVIKDKHNFCIPVRFEPWHQEKMSIQYIPPYTPLLYSKTGVYRSIPILLQNIDCGYSLEPPAEKVSVYCMGKFS